VVQGNYRDLTEPDCIEHGSRRSWHHQYSKSQPAIPWHG
jgi:hypothetical protein